MRAHVRLGVERVADPDGGRLGLHEIDDVLVDAPLDEETRARLAALARRVVDPVGGRGDGVLEVGVREDEDGSCRRAPG